MPTYLDLLPDELYQKIMSPLFAQCVEEVAHKRNITINHRTLQGHCADGICEELFAGSKSHLAVVYAWLVGKKKRGARMWTDGKRLYSYNMVLGCTLSGDYKVMRQMTSRTGCFVSQSTSTHSNLAARYADLVYNTRMDIEMHNHLFEID